MKIHISRYSMPTMDINWHQLLIPTGSLLEIVLRGTLTYFFLFILFRILRRDPGALNLADLLLVVLVADASQNSMSNDYKSVTEGATLVLTLAFWNYFLDWASFKFPWIEKLTTPKPNLLIKNGRLIRSNLRKELISIPELLSQIRQEGGIEDIKDIKSCYLESDGRFSVIKKEDLK